MEAENKRVDWRRTNRETTEMKASAAGDKIFTREERAVQNVPKQRDIFYIMTRPRRAPSILSFFCFRSATCFSLLAPLK